MNNPKPVQRNENNNSKNNYTPSPHSIEVEQALMCCCLIDPDALAQIYGRIHKDMFYDRRHALIFSALTTLFDRGMDIDILTVSDHLRRKRDLESIGGDSYLASLTSTTATGTHVIRYADQVKEYYSLRKIIKIMEIKKKLIDHGEESSVIAEGLINEISNLNSEVTNSMNVEFKDVAKEVVKEIKKTMDDEVKDKYKDWIKTGIPKLDTWLGGIRPGRMYTIAASPGSGKSDASMNWALNFSRSCPVGFISAEMSAKDLALRTMAMMAQIDSKAAELGTLTKAQYNEFVKVLNINRYPIIINDKSGPTAPFVRSQAVTMKAQKGIKVLFIDHLQEFKFHTKSSDDYKRWADITHDLRNIGKDLDIAIILINQLVKSVRQEKRSPRLGDVKGSGEEDSDVILLLSPVKKKNCPERLLMNLVKNRRGPLGKITCYYDKTCGIQRQLESEDKVSTEKNQKVEPDDEQEDDDDEPENEKLPF